MTNTATFTVHDLLRETALNANVLHGVFHTSAAGTGRQLVSDDVANWGITSNDLQSAWVFVPRLGAVRSCADESVDDEHPSTLHLRSGLDIASGEEFWLSRENPTVLSTAVRQQLSMSLSRYEFLRMVVIKPGDRASLDAAVGDTGGWHWQAGELRVRIDDAQGVDYVYAGELAPTFSGSLGLSGMYDDWEFDPVSKTLRLRTMPTNIVYTVRVRVQMMGPGEALSLDPLSAAAGRVQIGDATVSGASFERGIDGPSFLSLVYNCAAQVFDQLQAYAGYEERLGLQRMATSRRNRAMENEPLATGRLT